MKGKKVCELCSEEASLYCDADSAFLCRSCDAEVHSANFLVARHVRQPLCSNCKAFAGNCISGADLRHLRSVLCQSCSPLNISAEDQDEDDSSLSSDSSSICVSRSKSKKLQFEDQSWTKVKERIGSSSSITDLSGGELSAPVRFAAGEVSSKKKKTKKERDLMRASQGLTRVDAKAEGIFGNWCREMGLDGNFAVVALASHALQFCMGNSRVLPFRVSLAASFWYGLRSCREKSSARTIHGLRRLEEVSGVPAKLIVAVELRLAHELRVRKSRRRVDDLEEGWAEC